MAPGREGAERHIEVRRTARYHVLGPEAGPVRELWFVLHGYRQLASRFLSRFAELDDGSRLLVAPEALSRFYVEPAPGRHGPGSRVGATWMTRDDRENEIRDYVRYLDDLRARVLGSLAPPPPAEVVLGFSQGCATAARWVVLGAARPRRLVLWGDYLPPDLPEEAARERLASVTLTVVHGRNDPSLREDLTSAQAGRLSRWGVPWEARRYDGGHDVDRDALAELAAEVAVAGGPPETGT